MVKSNIEKILNTLNNIENNQNELSNTFKISQQQSATPFKKLMFFPPEAHSKKPTSID